MRTRGMYRDPHKYVFSKENLHQSFWKNARPLSRESSVSIVEIPLK